MRAAVYHGRLDVRIEDVPGPGPPGPGQMLLRVLYASVCGTDLAEYRHGPKRVPLHEPHPVSGHVGPVILGHEFVGEVVAVGPGVQRFSVGERVVPGCGWWCGTCPRCADARPNVCENYYLIGLQAHGGLAELAQVPARMCQQVPDGCDDEAAAVAQPLAIALHALRRSQLGRGKAVAVIGAGGIGAFLVAGAHERGAAPLVAVDIDPQRLRTAVALGATHTVHTVGDIDTDVKRIRSLTGLDIAVEASGTPDGLAVALKSVHPGGRVLLVGLQEKPVTSDLHPTVVNEIDIFASNGLVSDVDLPEALELLATTDLGKLVRHDVIPLDALVPEGLQAMAARRAHGKVVVAVSPVSTTHGRSP
jgi:(R,R)-butanediol dehydrogenase / meso-butanediol dehydrogenase / diacetyl reductase